MGKPNYLKLKSLYIFHAIRGHVVTKIELPQAVIAYVRTVWILTVCGAR